MHEFETYKSETLVCWTLQTSSF